MNRLTTETWTERYREAIRSEVIKERATVRGTAVSGLASMEVEVACATLEAALQAAFLPTARCIEIIQGEGERALAHALKVYADPTKLLQSGYWGIGLAHPNIPSLLTGPAGTGKSELRKAIARVFSGRRELWIDESHPRTPLVDYVERVLGSEKSITGVLRPLAGPEVAAGRVRVKESELPAECARWQRICGTCLLGVDEMQFMTQSKDASTLVTKTLLALAEVQLPWFAATNYSLCWKLLGRPAEATQRLLSRPVILLPDAADSEDWQALLDEYTKIVGEAFAFKLSERPIELWNLSAGLKRELVKLIVHSYRMSRRRGAAKVEWGDVIAAFLSVEFYVPRRDIKLLIAHAAQGGDLRKDLLCPFTGRDIDNKKEAYAEQLRQARLAKVADRVIRSAMTASEKKAIAGLQSQPVLQGDQATAKVIPIRRRGPRTLEGLLDAGRRARQKRGKPLTDA